MDKIYMFEVMHWCHGGMPEKVYCLADNAKQAEVGVKTAIALQDFHPIPHFVVVNFTYEINGSFLAMQTSYKISFDFRVKQDA